MLSLRAEARRPRRRGWKFSFELSQSGLWGPDAVSMAGWNDVARSTKGILAQGMSDHAACVPGTASRGMGFCNFGGAIRMSSSSTLPGCRLETSQRWRREAQVISYFDTSKATINSSLAVRVGYFRRQQALIAATCRMVLHGRPHQPIARGA